MRERVGRLIGLVGKLDQLEDLPDAIVLLGRHPLEHVLEHLSLALQRDHDVVVDRQGLVHVRHLELPADAGLEDLVGRLRPVMSWPANKIFPDVGLNWPVIMAISVVLPAPFGPSSTRSSFSSTLKSRLLRIV